MFWDLEHVDISAKVKIYLAIPINLSLWGCQTWALIKVLTNKLEVLHMRCLRRILRLFGIVVTSVLVAKFKS